MVVQAPLFVVWSVAAGVAGTNGVVWHVLPDTDWLDNTPGGNTCEVRANNASECADACLSLDNCVATSWNSLSDKCCNFKCSSKHQVHLKGEQGVVVRAGADLCDVPPPPPSPIAPTTLCSKDIPSDWLEPCHNAELFFESPLGPQQAPSLLPEVSVRLSRSCVCLNESSSSRLATVMLRGRCAPTPSTLPACSTDPRVRDRKTTATAEPESHPFVSTLQ